MVKPQKEKSLHSGLQVCPIKMLINKKQPSGKKGESKDSCNT